MNIKPIIDSTRISLEKEAADRFGTVVEDFSRGVLGPALGLPTPLPGEQVPFNRNDGAFYSSSYAAALAGGTSYRPKLKFLFKVEFIFTPEAIALFPSILGGSSSNDFTFMIKSVDRPKIDFEYDDDVNMYNFRTRVLKRIRHRELTIIFADDTGNRVLNFFRSLMMINSPITRRQLLRQNTSTNVEQLSPPNGRASNIGNGMAFETLSSGSINDTAIRGVVNSNVGNVIQTIRVKQIFINPGEHLGNSTKEVIFDFINARLISFDLDELTHESSDISSMTMQFDYDWMEIVDITLQDVDSPIYNITTPGIGGAPVDISVYGKEALSNPGTGNAFADIVINQLGRGTQQLTSETINRGVASIAGKGRFATLLGSQASNILGGVIGATTRNLGTTAATGIGGIISGGINGIRNSISSITNSNNNSNGSNGSSNFFTQAFARPSVVNVITPSFITSRVISTNNLNIIDSTSVSSPDIIGVTTSFLE